jgi:Leucine-rich repeat (LRR) protein
MYSFSAVVYVAGYTTSTDFPTLNQYQGCQGAGDAIVSKLDTKLSGQSSLIYSTYLGGGAEDHAYAIALDGDFRVYVTGRTNSTDFPTLNQYQGYQGDWDVFVSRLDTNQEGAASLLYSTYLGGEDWDEGNSIAVEYSRNASNAYVTGYTKSTNFPILNQYQVDPGYIDVFVTLLDTDKIGAFSLNYSTYLGGGASQYGTGIALDPGYNVYLTGETSSTDFPILNQYQGFQGTTDVFVTKIFTFQPTLPIVTTTAVSNITSFTAASGGNITGDGGAEVISRGVCWSTSQYPTIDDTHTTDGNGTGVFTSSITGLTPDTVYYVRAYAANAAGTAYGNQETFETDNVFIIVTYPSGGETLVVGSGHNITWTSSGVEGNVKIEYSIDNGSSWTEIVSSTENDGSYPWTVPYAPSYLCLIRVSETDGSTSGTSDSVFTITTSSIVIPASEREVLIALYNGTSGPQWIKQTNWKKPDGSFNDPGTEYTWKGIRVVNNHVTGIDLSFNQLAGTLTAEIINFPYLSYLDLSENDLNGNIPAEIGNFTNLRGFNLNDNDITGTIPASLGNLVNLESFVCRNNRLSGSLPDSLTNLVNLRHLDLENNDIEGNIPSEIGNLTQLDSLILNNNALTGGIPASIGNLLDPEHLLLNGNKLTGSIPTSLTNFSYLLNIEIGHNALYTDDEALIDYLNKTTSHWQDTQTIAPSDVSAAVLSKNAIEVSWTPIIYTDNEGGYRVFYSTAAGGPYTLFDITADKTVSSITVTGLNPGTTYYFVVQARTLPFALNEYIFNENTVDSEYSNEVSAATYSSITATSPNGGENWDVGSFHTITWTSEGTIGNVMIEYSTNNGDSWKTIVQSTENDGTYNWKVPYHPSDNCLVRISETGEDGSPLDVSDAVFSIVSPVSGSITLRSPNGGETWLAGSTRQIKWNSTGTINNVTIKYSTDNGTSWKKIAQTTANDGSYNWVVPETASDKCLVRVKANDSDLDPKPSDVSDAVFSISLPPSPTIRVTAPNGGEQLVVGSRFTVTWRAANTREDVRIEYSVNGGESWREITAAAENNGKYDWNVPDAPSDNCLVRVSETGGQPSDVSDALFSIVSPTPGDITVTSPNGGETWTAGSSREIKWSSNGGIDGVKIEYSRDNGITWKTIVQTTPNSGNFDWTVPGIASDECLVRITSNDVVNDPIPADVSDALFSIVPPESPAITVIAPNGGEQLIVGSSANITWHAVKSREDVKIEYSVNSGDTWTIIAESVDNNGDYEWIVPDTPSEICLVRVSEIDGQPVDVSDAVFSIVQPVPGEITVTAPNGGESWTVGSLQEIKWTAGGINHVTIECSADYGTTWQVIVQTTANDGSFDWTIPDIVSDECLVRVSSNDGDPDPVPSDISDEVFSMVPDSAGEFRVTSPNGGESWELGSTQSIKWTNSGDINSVMIEYSYDNGNTWNTIVSSVSNSGSYDWQVPDTVSEECLVRVTANDGDSDPKLSDVSDSNFSIVLPSSPTIRVITPNGGEQAVIGSIYKITWFGTNSRAEVKIEYSINGGQTWTEITGSTENDGDHDWLVPDEPSETCLVRISEIDGQPVDVSDAVFSIVQPQIGDLTVLTPNGGENLETGYEYNISWTCSGLNNVIIEYSVNNGATWLYIDKVPADNGSYTWTVPGTLSDNCVVRVTGADSDENPSDISDEVFTIFDPTQASIEVFTPNGGESLYVGEEYYITWASSGINNVLIEYSTNNGEQWLPIDTVPAIGGRFTWTVPDTPSESCLIRISAVPSGEPLDMSDAVFSIVSN